MIRNSEDKDFADVMEIIFSKGVNEYLLFEKNTPLEKQKERWSRLKESMIVFEENNKVIGFFCYHDLKGRKKHILEIGPLAVLPDKSKKGVGRQMFDHIFNMFKDKKMMIQCSVTEGNPAIKFYKKLGFKEDYTKKNNLLVDGQLKGETFITLQVTSPKDWMKSLK